MRKISKIGREPMAAAGVKNLAAFRQLQRPNIGAEMDRWRAEMLAELGTSVNARSRALVDGATATYGCIILVINKLRSARIADSGRLLERTSFLVGNLDRLLKRLELPPKPRPRSLSDLFPSKVALTSAIQTEKAAIPVESKVKTL